MTNVEIITNYFPELSNYTTNTDFDATVLMKIPVSPIFDLTDSTPSLQKLKIVLW